MLLFPVCHCCLPSILALTPSEIPLDAFRMRSLSRSHPTPFSVDCSSDLMNGFKTSFESNL